jgi:MtaA/CmuA family methyltransferase
MTGRELVLTAMERKPVERVPWVPFCGVHSARLIGATATDFLQDANLIVSGQSKAVELYHPDGLPVVFDLQIEAEILGCELRWSDENPPAVVSHPLESSLPAWSDLRLPAAGEGRLGLIMDATHQLRDQHPDLALYGLVTGPFTLALHLRGSQIFTDMYDTPGDVQALIGFCSEVACRMADFYMDAGCDIIAMVDPMTSQIGPQQFRQFCAAPSKRIFDHVREKGRKSSFFVCGHAQANIEAMCDTRCDNISIDENIPLDYVKEICTEKGVSFGGNLQLTVVMLTGNEDDNRRNALSCLDIGGNEGFILAPGCDIPFATPAKNIQAIAEVVHDPYKRQIARQLLQQEQIQRALFDMSEYGAGDHVTVDIITLDSEACAPCQYMVESVKQVAPQFEGIVVWREHKIKNPDSIDFMSSLMVHNIPTICIDGQITFVSTIPPRERLIAAIQQRINEKLKVRLQKQIKLIRVFGSGDNPETAAVRENVKTAIKELGVDIAYQEIEQPEDFARFGITATPAVATAKQYIKSVGKVPPVIVIKEWLKQLEE